MPRRAMTDEERDAAFWLKVSKTAGCWLWTAGVSKSGYGGFGIGGRKMVGAHVYSYQLHCGPTGGLFVLHTCDIKLCVRPDHLFLGTQLDNMRDKVSKGRQTRGETYPNSKLTREEGETVRWLVSLRLWTLAEIGVWFGVSKSAVWAIKSGRLWA